MTLKELAENSNRQISNKNIFAKFNEYKKYAYENKLYAYYSVEEIADATYYELRNDYSASEIRRAFIWGNVTPYYSIESGFMAMTVERILKDAEREISDELEAAIAAIDGK